METKLGFVLSGPVCKDGDDASSSTNLITTHLLKAETITSSDKCALGEELSRFWDLDTIGIRPQEDTVHEQFLDGVTFKNGRYEVRLPWKDPHPILPDNYELTLGRLKGQITRLRKDPELLNEYNDLIKKQVEQGIVEEVSPDDTTSVGRVHYIPHHPVVRRDKQTTKVRIVYDASAKRNGPSLNDCLFTGPSLLPKIMEILLRFRYHKIGLVADVEKAFHQVSIAEEDRDFLRFIWIDDIVHENPKLLIYRFTRVVFGVNSSPFLLNATIDHHIRSYTEDMAFVELFLRSLYVDDLNGGGSTRGDVLELYQKASLRMSEGGFTLRKWRTNDAEVQRVICERERYNTIENRQPRVTEDETTYARAMIGGSEEQECYGSLKVLGIDWDTVNDQLIFKTSVFTDKSMEPFTKRSILRTTAKIYDPLGVIAPVILPMKLLFQRLCLEKWDWDVKLNDRLQDKVRSWLVDFQAIQSITIPRCYLNGISGKIISTELHGFGDTSKFAYAGVVYLRTITDREIAVQLVAAKTRVAPVDKHSIPRLELLSATILARLLNTVKDTLQPIVNIDKIYCWLDSLTALYWIRQEDKEWKPFVQNRVSEIRKLVPVSSWLHCPSEKNMADVASRGTLASQLVANDNWWNGPKWLQALPSAWPCQKTPTGPTPEANDEIRASSVRLQRLDATGVMLSETQEVIYDVSKIIKAENFSNLHRLLRVTAYISRFLLVIQKRKGTGTGGPLTTEEVKQAERVWVRAAQQQVRKSPRYEQWKSQLGLYEDTEGIIRSRGRIGMAKLPHGTKFPALIPSNHHLTTLVIKDCHIRVGHNGIRETLAESRSRFWVVRGRQVVRKAIFRCVTCRRFEGRPYPSVTQAPLPSFRVADDPAFTSTGVDFAGPLFIRPDIERKAGAHQVYLALFTCASSRAVHLDLVPDLSTASFIRCFRRFTSRRGIPRRIISDNAKTFKAAAKKLSHLFDLPEVQSFLTQKRVSWSFNLERAPWWGGFFERMIKCTKRCLKKILRRAMLSYKELQTVIIEIEAILNSRPLTYQNAGETEEPLTPSHLLIGQRVLSLPEPIKCEGAEESTHATLTRRERYLTNTITQFWRRWQKEYLLGLREHHNLSTRKTSMPSIALGDIVTVHPENRLPKAKWKLGKVEQLIKSGDGKVRGAVVRIGDSRKSSTCLRRPIQKLIPLEVRHIEDMSSQPEENVEERSKEDTLRRSTRTAAIVGNYRRQLVDQCLEQD